MAAVIRAEDYITSPGERIYIIDIAFGCSVFIWWYVAMIEDDHRPAARWFFSVRDCKQSVYLKSFRFVRGDVALIICARIQHLFDNHFARRKILLAQILDR